MLPIESLTRVYACPGGNELKLHITRPRGATDCPALLDIHGGAWTFFDHRVDFYWCRELAARGYVVASADFRQAPVHPWPQGFVDLRAAARWLRAHAAELGADPGCIGAIGGSTGGHLATLLGLWPFAADQPMTTAIGVADDADSHLNFVVALWPILDVPGRYRMVTETIFDVVTQRIVKNLLGRPNATSAPSAEGTSQRLQRIDELRRRRPLLGEIAATLVQQASLIGGILPISKALLYDTLRRAHEGAFASLVEMEEASPLHYLRRTTLPHLPPLLIVQGERDTNMTVAMTNEFAAEYRRHQGHVEAEFVRGQGHSFGNIPSNAADALVQRIDRFVGGRFRRSE